MLLSEHLLIYIHLWFGLSGLTCIPVPLVLEGADEVVVGGRQAAREGEGPASLNSVILVFQ